MAMTMLCFEPMIALFFLLLAFSVHIMCLPTNLANSLSGLSFSAEVILGMYLLIGPPHSRSNYRVWCKYCEDLMANPTAIWNFFHRFLSC